MQWFCPSCGASVSGEESPVPVAVCPRCGQQAEAFPEGAQHTASTTGPTLLVANALTRAMGPAGTPGPQQCPENGLPPRIGRYVVQNVIGTGSFGTVYLARDTDLDR